MSVSFNASHLKRILPDLANPEENFAHLERALIEFGIGEFDEVAHLLGQIGHETGGGKWFQELDNASGTYLKGKVYYPYYGRGAIHLTWKETYAAAAAHFDAPFVKNPGLVSTVQWRWRVACWFFAVYKDLTAPARRADFDAVMRGVLGTSAHPSRPTRWMYYTRACQTLPIPWRLNGQLRTRGDRGLDYLWPAVEEGVDYDWWLRGNVPDGPMAYARNAPPPDIEQVIRDNAMFCVAPNNLIHRAIGKRVATKGDPRFDGGIAATWGGVFGPGYYHEYREPYDPNKDYPHMTLAGSEYWNNALQGHNEIILGNGKALDCNAAEGLQANHWHSSQGPRFGIKWVVMPWNCWNYEGDDF